MAREGGGEGGGEVGVSGEAGAEGVSVSEEEEEVVVNGKFVRMLQDPDVETFEGAVACNSVFEGVTSYDLLFNTRPALKTSAAGGGLGDVSARDAALEIESEEEAARTRFVIKFEGKVVSRHPSRKDAEEALIHAELARLRWAPRLRGDGEGLPGDGVERVRGGTGERDAGLNRVGGVGGGAGDGGGANVGVGKGEGQEGVWEKREWVWQERVAALEALGRLPGARGHDAALRCDHNVCVCGCVCVCVRVSILYKYVTCVCVCVCVCV